MKLIDIASVIRSKNSGPYELTFDVIFKDFETYGKVKAAQAGTVRGICVKAGDAVAVGDTVMTLA